MSESETGIVCCEDIGKYKIRTRDRGSNERGGNNICVNVCKKGRNSSRFGLEEDIELWDELWSSRFWMKECLRSRLSWGFRKITGLLS